jgi:hypothetical protein
LDSALPEEYRNLSLAEVGVRVGDLVSAADHHYQIVEAQ